MLAREKYVPLLSKQSDISKKLLEKAEIYIPVKEESRYLRSSTGPVAPCMHTPNKATKMHLSILFVPYRFEEQELGGNVCLIP